MIESLVISLREGIEVALVLGILVVYLRRINRSSLVRPVYAGLGAAVAASIGGAIALQAFSIDHELLEGYFMVLAAGFVTTMVVWMWLTARGIRREIERKVDMIVESSSAWHAHLGMFLFTFMMIVREGIETVIFLQAVAMSTGAWLSFTGTLLGLGFAAAFAVFFIQGSLKIDIVRFLRVTAVTLLIFVSQLVVNGLHEFYEYGVLPASPGMMGILGPIVRNNILFIIAIISIPALMLIIPSSKTPSDPLPAKQRRIQLSVGLAALSVVLFLGVGNVFSSSHSYDLSATPLEIPGDGVIRIPLETIDDANIHRFSILDRGVEIRFFVLRTSLGKFVTAFDACYACYNYGRYYLRDGELICSQCDAPSSLMKLKPAAEEERDENMSGSMEGNGCSPIYLASVMKRGEIQITLQDLQRERKYFETSANSAEGGANE